MMNIHHIAKYITHCGCSIENNIASDIRLSRNVVIIFITEKGVMAIALTVDKNMFHFIISKKHSLFSVSAIGYF